MKKNLFRNWSMCLSIIVNVLACVVLVNYSDEAKPSDIGWGEAQFYTNSYGQHFLLSPTTLKIQSPNIWMQTPDSYVTGNFHVWENLDSNSLTVYSGTALNGDISINGKMGITTTVPVLSNGEFLILEFENGILVEVHK